MAAVLAALALVAAACTTPAPGEESLTELKRSHYGTLAQAHAASVGQGLAQPVVEFSVKDTPPSIFVNYVIPDAQAAAFVDAIELPPGFDLAKVRILESDPAAQYWLSLNVYRVGGITTGLRAEWSTYVDDGSGEPRFMIVRARAADGSLDPIGPLALPEPFSHAVDVGGLITTSMNRTELQGGVPVLTGEHLYSSSIQLPDEAGREYVLPTHEWFGANDFIYWMNGVNDRVFQNATAHSAPLISVDLDDVSIDDDTEWMPYLEAEPRHVLVYLDEIQFTLSPWWNVTELDGLVDAATLAELQPLKASLYEGLGEVHALSVLNGSEQAALLSTVEGAPPSVTLHWEVAPAELAAFEAEAGLAPGLALAPLSIAEADATPSYWLGLEVRRVTGAQPGTPSGTTAQWITYVHDGDTVRSQVLATVSDHATLDPVDRFVEPGPATLTSDGNTLELSVGAGAEEFSAEVALEPALDGLDQPTRALATANELRYWSNGVADRFVRDSNVFEPVVTKHPSTVATTGGGRWEAFMGTGPDRVWVSERSTDVVTSPWVNR